MSYPYPLTATTETKYKKIFRSSKYISADDIEILTVRRELLRKALSEKYATPLKAFEAHIKALEEYLPSLFAAVKAVAKDTGGESSKGVPEFTWRSMLSKGSRKPNITCGSLNYELGYVLLIYGITLSNYAATLLNIPTLLPPSFPNAWPKNTTPPSEPLRDERFNAAANLLCRAAGIFDFWAEDPEYGCQRWINLPSERPPEILKGAAKALSLVSLADAQRLALLKTLSRSSSSASSPQSPTSPTVSRPLLIKLAQGVESLYRDAEKELKTLDVDYKDLAKEFLAYVKDMQEAIMAGVVRVLAAEGKAIEGQNGEAVGLLEDARTRLLEASKSSECPAIKDLAARELSGVEVALDKYKKLNDMVTLQQVPSSAQVAKLFLAEPKVMMEAKKFVVPALAFDRDG
ncbi:hypothetical protein HDV00_002092 [Rhizophlyctis rosea]|nr:hypothetical protein HDV00_002092 [Rhizophlyctis rosea]